MKTDKLSPAYFSTSEVAKVLSLSVGTVQRMVEHGVFKAFVTQGGHRRILASSLDEFVNICDYIASVVPSFRHDVAALRAFGAAISAPYPNDLLSSWITRARPVFLTPFKPLAPPCASVLPVWELWASAWSRSCSGMPT